jgi:hypothetical protein
LNYGRVRLSPERRRWLLREALDAALPGDLLFFYHRTSWRSRWIRRITACDLPHVCVYSGEGRIVGMLRGQVRRHFLRRFFRDEYEVRFVRGSPEILRQTLGFLGKREAWFDLAVLALLVLLERALGARMGRRLLPYRMRGVTCSGVVSTAWHRANGARSWCDPMKHTPLDLEERVGKLAFLEASLLPTANSAPSTRKSGRVGRATTRPVDT